MSNQYFLLFSNLQGPASSHLPGDLRLWNAVFTLHPEYKNVHCEMSTFIAIESDKAHPNLENILKNIYNLQNAYNLRKIETPKNYTLQVRKKGFETDSLSTLIQENLVLSGIDVKHVYCAQNYEFSSQEPNFIAALEKILTFKSTSGIYLETQEEFRTLKANESLDWKNISLPTLSSEAQECLELITWSLNQQNIDILKHPVIIREMQSGSQNRIYTSNNPYEDLIYAKDKEDSLASESNESSPLSFIVGTRPGLDDEEAIDTSYQRAKRTASLHDRCIALVTRRQFLGYSLSVDLLGETRSNYKKLSLAKKKGKTLYILGPWDARNSVVSRRYEFLLHHYKTIESALKNMVITDGNMDWMMYLLEEVISKGNGWSFLPINGIQFLRYNRIKTRNHRIGFFWDDQPESLLKLAKKIGCEISALGQLNEKGTVEFLDQNNKTIFDISMKEVQSLSQNWALKQYSCSWNLPMLKATTYGFDKASYHADQYLIKLMSKSESEKSWRKIAWACSSGERILSASMRNKLCAPRGGFIWHDGEGWWCETVASKEGWSDNDPEAAGLASVDFAIREQLCLGAEPSKGFASLWIPQPEWKNAEVPPDNFISSYYLILRGATDALKTFGYKLVGFNSIGVSRPQAHQEVHVWLRSKMPETSQQTIPGFRIEGEILYVVGPKPTYMDSGSRILRHTKVSSNHVFKLLPQVQLDVYQTLYELIQKNVVVSSRAVGQGGVAEALAEMVLWSGLGAQIRPGVPVIELYSASPGRLVVGVLPQSQKEFENAMKSEFYTLLGIVGGDKILGLPITKLKELEVDGLS